jgi:hypothetical protein
MKTAVEEEVRYAENASFRLRETSPDGLETVS